MNLKYFYRLVILCFSCDVYANQADEIHNNRNSYLDGGVYAGVGLPYLVTLGAMLIPRWRNFDYAPVVLLELNTSIIATQFDLLFGLQRVDAGVYRSILLGYNNGDAGLVERSSSWAGLTLRYQQFTLLHDSAYFTRFWAVDLDMHWETRLDDEGEVTFGPSIRFGWTFAPF